MKRPILILATVLSLSVLSGCVISSGYSGGYIGYYDGYYGPYYSGYWATDGFFYFSDRSGRYYRDEAKHFRREPGNGYNRFEGRPPANTAPPRDWASPPSR
jgi:hypothetical protein